MNDIQNLEHAVIIGAAQLLGAAMKLAEAQDNAMMRRAQMVHDAQGLVPILTITCPHGNPTALAISLGYADPVSGMIKAQLFALSAHAEQLQ